LVQTVGRRSVSILMGSGIDNGRAAPRCAFRFPAVRSVF
jgi:hypothetical protein